MKTVIVEYRDYDYREDYEDILDYFEWEEITDDILEMARYTYIISRDYEHYKEKYWVTDWCKLKKQCFILDKIQDWLDNDFNKDSAYDCYLLVNSRWQKIALPVISVKYIKEFDKDDLSNLNKEEKKIYEKYKKSSLKFLEELWILKKSWKRFDF